MTERRLGFGPALVQCPASQGSSMNRIIYIVGLIVVVVAVLSFFGLG